MKAYKDIDGDSGIAAYDYGEDWIKVQFNGGQTYIYQASKIVQTHISAMRALADAGEGFHSYIMRNPTVKNGWSSKN